MLPGGGPAAARARRAGRAGGFTIFELVLVMVVLVLAAGVVLPGLPAYARGAHLRGSALRLAGMARYAGEWAAQNGRAVTLGYDEERRTFTLDVAEDWGEEELAIPVPEDGDAGDANRVPAMDAARRSLRLPESVSLAGGESGEGEQLAHGGQVRFYPDGSADDATLVLGTDQQSWTVRVGGRRGRVTVEQGDALEEGVVGHAPRAR